MAARLGARVMDTSHSSPADAPSSASKRTVPTGAPPRSTTYSSRDGFSSVRAYQPEWDSHGTGSESRETFRVSGSLRQRSSRGESDGVAGRAATGASAVPIRRASAASQAATIRSAPWPSTFSRPTGVQLRIARRSEIARSTSAVAAERSARTCSRVPSPRAIRSARAAS